MAERPPIRDWPRGMPIEVAAEYCGIGPATLRDQGPPPVRVGAKRLVWLRDQLDAWLDGLAGIAPASAQAEENPFDSYVYGADETRPHLHGKG